MHPGMMYWWKQRHAHGGCGGEAHAEHGPGHGHERGPHWGRHGWRGFDAASDEGGGFGVRRPLRFLAYKLELSEPQVAELARILSELKTERAQAEVDGRRTTTAFADALSAEAFDQGKAQEGGALRVKSAERLRDAVTGALQKIHALLTPEQRAHLAYLIRTGVVQL